MPYVIDYKEEVKRIISDSYEPGDFLNKEFKYTTAELTALMKSIVPYNAVDEHVIYESMIELGYEPIEEEPLQYFWMFTRKSD